MLDELKRLDELIQAGWGHVRQDLIPPDWKNRKPPDRNIREECLEDAIEDEPAEVIVSRPDFRKTLCPKRGARQREIGKAAAGGRG